jgi:hypothetical protein
MLKRKMEQVEVYVKRDQVFISQQDSSAGDEQMVVLSPHQIDILVQWLQEAKAEALEYPVREDEEPE